MPRCFSWIGCILLMLALPASAQAFCGFYVAKADSRLYNSASRVVLARKDDTTTVTMEANYQGAPRDFAMVVPVPTLIARDQIRVVDAGLVDRIDNYTAPRLVEYNDPDPCWVAPLVPAPAPPPMSAPFAAEVQYRGAKALGVTIEARYEVGEYDILLLSATQSGGLIVWLTQNGYRIPPGAEPVIGSYLKQNMKFFVARINLQRHAGNGTETLRPLQITYRSPKFMLPIRLGTVNATGPQELFVFALTSQGRIETTNYRTAKLPSDLNIPSYTKSVFPAFYKATFDQATRRAGVGTVFLEYGWDASFCDPCSADPLSAREMKELGVTWNDSGGGPVYVTRLHLRYSRDSFPEDLMLQETRDDTRFQGRYVMNHPFTGPIHCKEGRAYRNQLVERWNEEARNLVQLTGWSMQDVTKTMRLHGDHPTASLGPGGPHWWFPAWKQLAAFWNR